jgi:hypothetical protein
MEKAYIVAQEGGLANQPIPCMFNPREYTLSKSNSWQGDNSTPTNAPELVFGGGQPISLKMQLLFDTYSPPSSGRRDGVDVRKDQDVRDFTGKIWQMMMVDDGLLKDAKSKAGRPPKVMFIWGKQILQFEAVITSLSQQFTLFLPDGTPVRALLDITFDQVRDNLKLSAQNPTSGGLGGERVWTVREGDTLSRVAHQEYGNTNDWRKIAEANNLSDVRNLRSGQTLIIPTD